MIEIKITLKNMIGRSCIKLIQVYFAPIKSIEIIHVFMGEVTLKYDAQSINTNQLFNYFKEIGFGVVQSPDEVLTEKIKVAAIELIMFSSYSTSLINNSTYIEEKVQESYDKISKIFSKVTGRTLEKYIIALKIEKAKNLLLDESYNLSEIAYQLGYSSVQYLSKQFKQMTGYTFSEFKKLDNPSRTPIDSLID